jgi:thiamine biosynthesis lipoprotein
MIHRDSPLDHPHLHRFSHQAMATVFEIFIFHEDETYSQQAAMEAFRLADVLEIELSRFVPNGDIGRINALSPGESTRVGIHAFACLKRGLELGAETGGCFDVFIGSLKDAWMNGDSRGERTGRIDGFRKRTGQAPLILSEESFEVRAFGRVTIDLGAFGKGYAVDRMAESLREWDVGSALVHGGRSSVYAFGRLADGSGWPVTISDPQDRVKILRRFELHNRAMGASGVEKGSHIFDPRTGEPVRERLAAWVLGPDAATADALSTAFMVMEPEAVRAFCSGHSELQAMVMEKPEAGTGSEARWITIGIDNLQFY